MNYEDLKDFIENLKLSIEFRYRVKLRIAEHADNCGYCLIIYKPEHIIDIPSKKDTNNLDYFMREAFDNADKIYIGNDLFYGDNTIRLDFRVS